VATAGAIEVVLRKGDATQRVLQEAASGFRISLVKETEHGEEVLDLDRLATDSDMSPIIKLVDTVIYNAMESRASDIHIETRDNAVHVKYRIDGALYEKVEPIDLAYHQTLISRIKVMSELDIAERRTPQDGRFRVRYKGRNVDFRVSIMPTVHGEDAVIRILDKEQINEQFRDLKLDVVGFDPDDVRNFRRYIAEPYGMVLVTGPTGSGKTTTLYAALNEIRNEEDKIITIEDPVEYQLHGVTQIPVNEKKGLTFARGLRSILRHDPDKIMVGEIRDTETAQIAIQSALTGHLVFTTVPRQQRHRRDRPLSQHGRRALQLRVEPELRAGAASRPHALHGLPPRLPPDRRRAFGVRTPPRTAPRGRLLYERRLRRLQPHGLPRPDGHPRTAQPVGQHPRDHHRPSPRLRGAPRR
jgi:type IV pilus assembly protein PilB